MLEQVVIVIIIIITIATVANNIIGVFIVIFILDVAITKVILNWPWTERPYYMQLLSDVKTGRPHRRQLSMSRQILNTDSFRSHASTPQSPDPDTDILSSQHNISRTGSTPMHSQPFAGGVAPHRDVSALEGEVESLRAELEETKRRMGADLAQAREEALGVMRATGQLPNVVICAAVVTGTGTGLGTTRARASLQAHVLCQGRPNHPKERGRLAWPLDP